MSETLCRCWSALRPSLAVWERMVFVFPLAVVLGATATFWFGGRCSPWHFAAGLAAAAVAALCHRGVSFRGRLGGIGLFALFLGAAWLLTGCMAFAGMDNVAYHLPVTQLLMEGWNPVRTSTAEALTAWSGLPTEGMWIWHVLYIAHPVEVFNAVFAFFTRTPLNLVLPLSLFMLPLAMGAAVRFARGLGWGRWAGAVAGLVLCGTLLSLIDLGCAVDCVVACAGCGTVLSMARIVRGERCWGALLAFSLWMMVAKQSSLLTCFVFWACFAATLLWQARGARLRTALWLAGCGAALTVGLCWVCTAPYLTSWARTGHPLYPAHSVDEAAFPSHDITADFHLRNADAQAMGHVAHFLNAYLSPGLVRAYHAWKLGKPDFLPYCEVWKQMSPRATGYGSPVVASWRGILLLAFLILMAGGRGLRFPAIVCAVGAFAFPTVYLGYLRYVPWLALLPALAAGRITAWLGAWRPRAAWCGGAALVLGAMGKSSLIVAFPIDLAFEAEEALGNPGVQALVSEKRLCDNHFRLLIRHAPMFQGARLLAREQVEDERLLRQWALPHFSVLLREGREPPSSRYRAITRLPSRTQRYLRYAFFVPETFARTLPTLLWRRLRGAVSREGRSR